MARRIQFHYHHNGEGSGTLLSPTIPSLVLKLVFGKVNLNSCCVPIFQSQASTVVEINSGSLIFSDAPLAQSAANFGLKRCFLVS